MGEWGLFLGGHCVFVMLKSFESTSADGRPSTTSGADGRPPHVEQPGLAI